MRTKVKRYPQTCKRCDHYWQSTKERPLQCVYCKSYKWDKSRLDAPKPKGEK